MARVTVETVDHVARLAHLTLTSEERATFTRHLAEILDYAEALQALDTSDVPPMSHAGTTGDFRADIPGASLERDRVLDASPDAADGLFRVPKVIGG
jgi:aspartyl-tRNA(Asn)/glutamyl-tRNA(Gln) amidotransferase subunit C